MKISLVTFILFCLIGCSGDLGQNRKSYIVKTANGDRRKQQAIAKYFTYYDAILRGENRESIANLQVESVNCLFSIFSFDEIRNIVRETRKLMIDNADKYNKWILYNKQSSESVVNIFPNGIPSEKYDLRTYCEGGSQ